MRRTFVSLLTVVASLLVTVGQGMAGPFGLSMDMRPEDFNGKLEITNIPYAYSTTEVPILHRAFVEYELMFSPNSGLCIIAVTGKTIETDTYGDNLKSAFDDMEARLARQYGKGVRKDFLKSGSRLSEPQDFMKGLGVVS